MKNLRKLSGLILIILIAAIGMAGCGDKNKTEKQAASGNTILSPQYQQTQPAPAQQANCDKDILIAQLQGQVNLLQQQLSECQGGSRVAQTPTKKSSNTGTKTSAANKPVTTKQNYGPPANVGDPQQTAAVLCLNLNASGNTPDDKSYWPAVLIESNGNNMASVQGAELNPSGTGYNLRLQPSSQIDGDACLYKKGVYIKKSKLDAFRKGNIVINCSLNGWAGWRQPDGIVDAASGSYYQFQY